MCTEDSLCARSEAALKAAEEPALYGEGIAAGPGALIAAPNQRLISSNWHFDFTISDLNTIRIYMRYDFDPHLLQLYFS